MKMSEIISHGPERNNPSVLLADIGGGGAKAEVGCA